MGLILGREGLPLFLFFSGSKGASAAEMMWQWSLALLGRTGWTPYF